MREILFHGKRKDNGEWVEGYYAKRSNYACFASELKYKHFILKDILTDKNGKKIFEDDIVKAEQWYNCGCYPHTEIRTFEVKIPDIYQIDIASV